MFQVIAFAGLGWFHLSVLRGWLGLPQADLDVSTWQIATSVLIFLGIPLLAGYLTRRFGERARGRTWYEERFLPRIGPFALYGLLFTIVVLFAPQGDAIIRQPWDVARIALRAVGTELRAHHHAGLYVSLAARRRWTGTEPDRPRAHPPGPP